MSVSFHIPHIPCRYNIEFKELFGFLLSFPEKWKIAKESGFVLNHKIDWKGQELADKISQSGLPDNLDEFRKSYGSSLDNYLDIFRYEDIAYGYWQFMAKKRHEADKVWKKLLL